MLRKCTLADEAIWKKLNEEFMDFEYEDDNVWENPRLKGDPAEVFREIVSNPNSPNLLYLVEENGEVIGFMNTAYFLSIWAHGKVLFLDDYFIREEYRGRGFGKKALSELESLLKDEGYQRIQLMAEDTNPNAVKFYLKENYSKQQINFFCKYIEG